MKSLPHILIVDDEELNLLLIKEFLASVECRISIAHDGQEALDLLLANPSDFDVILLDRMMPNIDGIGVLVEIKQHSILKYCPVIMQTGMALSAEIMEGMAAGAYYYLTKPFDGDMLLSIIKAALRDRDTYVSLKEELNQFIRPIWTMRNGTFAFSNLEEVRELALLIAQTCPDPEKAILGLSEILINAIEHGNLAIGYDKKTQLINDGKWEEEVQHRLTLDNYKNKEAILSFKKDRAGIHITVKDEGIGFDWKQYLTITPDRANHSHGRGIAIAATVCFNKLEYRGNGNEVYLLIDQHSEQ